MDNNASADTKKALLRKMIRVRSRILTDYPFYGHLVMHLQLGLADCGTAFTDMKHLTFDPDFAEQLSNDEMLFVMLHEMLHCALSHCTRCRNYRQDLYNIAADIVVNSIILHAMQRTDFKVAGDPVMHLVPDGREGCNFSTEEIYRMLLEGGYASSYGSDSFGSDSFESNSFDPVGSDPSKSSFDSHEIWSSVEENNAAADQWKNRVIEEGKKYSTENFPPSLRDYMMELEQTAKVDWRAVLQDFIQIWHDRFDYSFTPADRRYTWSDYVVPAFSEQEGEHVDDLWFCVDTSGSIDSELLSDAMSEIRQAILMFEHLTGSLSFFDTSVTDPVPFENADDILDIQPTGGGGTDFTAIFDKLREFPEDELPSAIIILTDGYGSYPSEKDAMDIPVLWIIYNSPEDPPWGRSAHIDSM